MRGLSYPFTRDVSSRATRSPESASPVFAFGRPMTDFQPLFLIKATQLLVIGCKISSCQKVARAAIPKRRCRPDGKHVWQDQQERMPAAHSEPECPKYVGPPAALRKASPLFPMITFSAVLSSAFRRLPLDTSRPP